MMTVAIVPDTDAVAVTVRTAMLKALLCKEIISTVPRKRSNYTVPVFYPRNLYAVEGCYYSSYRKENFVLPNSRHVQFDERYICTFSPGREKRQQKPTVHLTPAPVFDHKELLHKELLKKVTKCKEHVEATRLIDWLHRCPERKIFCRSNKAMNAFPAGDFVHCLGVHRCNDGFVAIPNAFVYGVFHKHAPMVHYTIGKYAKQHWAVQAYKEERSQKPSAYKQKHFEEIHKELLQKVLPCPTSMLYMLFGFIYLSKDGKWEHCAQAKCNWIAPNRLICAYRSVHRNFGIVIMPTCDHWADVTPFALNSILCYSIGCQPKEHWCVQAYKDEVAVKQKQKEIWRKVEHELLSSVAPCPSHQPRTMLIPFLYVTQKGFWCRPACAPTPCTPIHKMVAVGRRLFRSCGSVFFPNSDYFGLSRKSCVCPTLHSYFIGHEKPAWYLQAYKDEHNTLQNQRT